MKRRALLGRVALLALGALCVGVWLWRGQGGGAVREAENEVPSIALTPLYDDVGYRLHRAERYLLTQPEVDPSGRRFAFFAGHQYTDEELIVWDTETDTLRNMSRNFGRRSGYARLRWSGDGTAIAAPINTFQQGISFWVFPLEGEPVEVDGEAVAEFVWSPDSTRLAYVRHDLLHLIGRDGQAPRQLTSERMLGVADLVFWVDGGRTVVAFIGGWLIQDKNVYVVPLEGGEATPITTGGGFAHLRLGEGGDLIAHRQRSAPTGPVDSVRIAHGSHELSVIGPADDVGSLLQSHANAPRGRDRDVLETPGGERLEASRVERLVLGQRIAWAGEEGARLRAEPDPPSTPRTGSMRSLSRPSLELAGTSQVMARARLTGAERRLELGPVELDVLAVRVEVSTDQLAVTVLLRWLDRIDAAYLRTGDGAATSLSLQELVRPLADDPDVQGHYRLYDVLIGSIVADPQTGEWSEIELVLRRHDEVQHRPSIEGDQVEVSPAEL